MMDSDDLRFKVYWMVWLMIRIEQLRPPVEVSEQVSADLKQSFKNTLPLSLLGEIDRGARGNPDKQPWQGICVVSAGQTDRT